MQRKVVTLSAFVLAISNTVSAGPSSSPDSAKTYIISPKNGEVVSSPVTIIFGLSGMGVAPAGVQKDNTGHHHLLIDTAAPLADKPIPADDHHRHFGGGQTEATIELNPGTHTLQLLLGDWTHISHSPPVLSAQITVTVK